MTADEPVGRFRAVLATRLGWTFDDNDVGQLSVVLKSRTGVQGLDEQAYLNRLETGWTSEVTTLAEQLSITETYFFRHAEQFRTLAQDVMPERIRARAPQQALRMLSVGCSSGEEPYTLAIVAREVQPDPAWIISVQGIDANPAMLRKAAAARYSGWSLRETPDAIRERYFRPHDGTYDLDPRIKASVRFVQHNVADDDPVLWRPEQYDVVFCRNMLMYLTPATRAALITRMTRVLAPGGYLFLGHTDSLGSRPEGLEPQHTHHTFYYRRPERTPLPPVPAAVPAPAVAPAASLRPKAVAPPIAPDPHDGVLALIAADRFTDALALLEAGLGDRPQPRDLLLLGVLLAHSGRLDEAETVCRDLIDTDGLSADAHHLLAVCLEGGAAGEVAIGQYRLAAYLDAAFAMPRLRLGLLARRRGDVRGAGPELDRALELLREEREDRIVLFGGGFGRSALTSLCRAELDAIGARR
jgi:chemotaxis protein methyltransferase CheR